MHANYPTASTAKSLKKQKAAVIKPLINQLESSIQGQFRRMEKEHDKLKTKLSQNENHLHRRVWKMKSHESSHDLSNWHSKEDLRNYLTAMSLLGSSKNGGGRTFGKEKHSFFDNISHFKETLDAARQHKKESFFKKMARAGIRENSKKALFLWKQMNEPMGSANPLDKPPAMPAKRDEEKESKSTANTRPPSATTAAAEAEDDNRELTREEEEALKKLAKEDEAAGWAVGADGPSENDSAALARDALFRLQASISPQRSASARARAQQQQQQGMSNPYGVAMPDRKPGVPLYAPKLFRKASWQVAEEEEERLEAEAEAKAIREAEERRKKEEEERESRRRKQPDPDSAGATRGGRFGKDNNPLAAPASAGSRRASRRGSMVAGPKGGSVIASLAPSPHGSRRNSVVEAVQAMKALQLAKDPRALSPPSFTAPAPEVIEGDVSEEQFVSEAARVMGMVFSNSAQFLQPISNNVDDNNESSLLSSHRSGQSSSRSFGSAALENLNAQLHERREKATGGSADVFRLQDEIDAWNARTPRSERLGPNDGKTILTQAAEKLGVKSVASVGAQPGDKQPLTQTQKVMLQKQMEASSQKYVASFEARSNLASPVGSNAQPSPASSTNAAAAAQLRPTSAPHSARQKKPLTNFGNSPTSMTSNISSVKHAIDFKEPKGRKELVNLNSTVNPAVVFAGVSEGKLGSTLMSFEQLHQTNKQLAEEQRKRQEAALLSKAQVVEVVRKAKKQSEKDETELLRDKLAAKSRKRGMVSRDGSPTKTLTVSSSTGHLKKKSAQALVQQPNAAAAAGAPYSTLSVQVEGDAAADGSRPQTAGMSEEDFLASLSPSHAIHQQQEKDAAAAAARAAALAADPFALSASLKPTLSLKAFLSKSGHDYVHVAPALIVPKWDDVAKVIDYATLVPGYVPPPPKEEEKPVVTYEVKLDEDGFPNTYVTTTHKGVTTVEILKGAVTPSHAQSPSLTSSSSTTNAPSESPSSMSTAGNDRPGTSTGLSGGTSALFGGATATSHPPPPQDEAAARRAARRELDRKLLSQIDPDVFSTESARKTELKRLRAEALEPPPTSQGPSVFQAMKYGAFKSSYVKFVESIQDEAVAKRGAIGAQKIEPISGRKQTALPPLSPQLAGRSGLDALAQDASPSSPSSRPSTAGTSRSAASRLSGGIPPSLPTSPLAVTFSDSLLR